MQKSGKVYLICSDRPRNGKTLLARFCMAYLKMLNRRFTVIDLEPDHTGISGYCQSECREVDISVTMGQIELFDPMLADPTCDYILDLPARFMERFFDIVEKIDFFKEAEKLSLLTVIFFVVDRSPNSLDTARQLQRRFDVCRFIEVHNEAIGKPQRETSLSQFHFDPVHSGVFTLKRMRPETMDQVEHPNFEILDFLQSQKGHGDYDERQLDFGEFLLSLFDQFKDLHFKLGIDEISRQYSG